MKEIFFKKKNNSIMKNFNYCWKKKRMNDSKIKKKKHESKTFN